MLFLGKTKFIFLMQNSATQIKKLIMPNNIPALTSIRGLAALAVVFYHINLTFGGGLFFFSLFKHGDLGVDLFFVLSGFIMAYVYHKENMSKKYFLFFYRKFIISRIARIYPLHLITLLFTLGLVIILPDFYNRYPDYFTEASFIYNIFLIQNWGFIKVSWNMVSWSISAEWFMYLLFPFMLLIKSYIIKSYQIALLAVTTITLHYSIIFYYEWAGYGGMSLGGMIRVFFEFSLGFLVFFIKHLFKKTFISFKGNLNIIFSSLAVYSFYEQDLWFIFLPSVTLMIIHFSLINCTLSNILSKRLFIYFGNISFSLYMWHWLIIQIQNWLIAYNFIQVNDGISIYTSCITMILLSILVAHLSFLYIETPARRLGRKLI